jgi:hypothetical protein
VHGAGIDQWLWHTGSRGMVAFDRMLSSLRDLLMLLRRLPVIIVTPLARNSLRVSRRNAARTALDARQRRHEQEGADAFLERLTAQRRAATVRRP